MPGRLEAKVSTPDGAAIYLPTSTTHLVQSQRPINVPAPYPSRVQRVRCCATFRARCRSPVLPFPFLFGYRLSTHGTCRICLIIVVHVPGLPGSPVSHFPPPPHFFFPFPSRYRLSAHGIFRCCLIAGGKLHVPHGICITTDMRVSNKSCRRNINTLFAHIPPKAKGFNQSWGFAHT